MKILIILGFAGIMGFLGNTLLVEGIKSLKMAGIAKTEALSEV